MTAMTLALFVVVALCGGLGAVLRYVLDSFISSRISGIVPWGTFTINISGSLLLGFLTGLLAITDIDSAWLLAMGTGLLGGYTTFSTASFDTLRLLRAGHTLASLVYALGTLAASVLAAYGGYLLASLL